VRFVAATNRDLNEEGRFRQDLYFRLCGMTLTIPPLRERIADIEPLALSFAEGACAAAGRPVPAFSPEALATLQQYSWPGNIRELHNVIDRAVILCTGDRIDHIALPHEKMGRPIAAASMSAIRPDSLTREQVIDALQRSAGNQTRAAKLLGISRSTLVDRLEQFQIPRPRK
jgi:DNA-binding NtrC family response regulator